MNRALIRLSLLLLTIQLIAQYSYEFIPVARTSQYGKSEHVYYATDNRLYVAKSQAGLRAYAVTDSSVDLIAAIDDGQIDAIAQDLTMMPDGTILLANGMDGLRAYRWNANYLENIAHIQTQQSASGVAVGPDSSDLIITPTSVELLNPNNPPFHGPLDLEYFSHYPKNPNIRKFFTAFGWTEEIGSGVRNTCKYMEQYVPHAKPLFIENDLFRTEIPLNFNSLEKYAQELLTWFELSDLAMDHIRTGLTHIALNPESESLRWPDILLRLVPGWHQKGTRLTELDWPKKQALTENDIKKVPGWDEKGTKLFHKKIRYLIGILILVSEPISLNQMMKWMGYSKRKTFRDNYILPLQEVDFVKLTNPEVASDPEQKYVITEKGKLFLAGREM